MATKTSGIAGLFQFKTLTMGANFGLDNMANKLLTRRHGHREILTNPSHPASFSPKPVFRRRAGCEGRLSVRFSGAFQKEMAWGRRQFVSVELSELFHRILYVYRLIQRQPLISRKRDEADVRARQRPGTWLLPATAAPSSKRPTY